MASDQTNASPTAAADGGIMHPEDFTRHALPVVMRGYERERVDRLLRHISGAYTSIWQQNQALRERMRALELDLAESQDEARVSARSLAELMHRSAPAASPSAPTRKTVRELEGRLSRSERDHERALGELRAASARAAELEQQLGHLQQEHEQALAELQSASARAAELEERFASSERDRERAMDELRLATAHAVELAGRLETIEQEERQVAKEEAERPRIEAAEGEASRVLLAATRAADDVRASSRARALGTLTAARARATKLDEQAARERDLLAAAQARRDEAEREADELLRSARTEVGRLAASVDEEVHRVRELLTGTLSALDAEVGTAGLVADLELRVQRAKEPAGD